MIISNPPFTQKDAVLKRLYELGKPFAILLPLNSLQGVSRYKYFKQGIQILTFDKRIGFHNPENMKEYKKGSSFATAYFCKDVLPKDLIVEELKEYQKALKNRDTDGLGLIPEKWYDVLDVECHGEKGRFGEVKKVLIQSEKKRDPEWYKAEYFILAAEAQAYADNQAAAGAAQPASLMITTRNALEMQEGLKKQIENSIWKKANANLMFGA